MRPLGLRARFFLACALLVATTVGASIGTLAALLRLSQAVGDTVRESDETTAGTAAMTAALEREDDALLLVLAGDVHAEGALVEARASVDAALHRLGPLLHEPRERAAGDAVREDLERYRAAASLVAASASEKDALVRYHREANPLLRRAAQSVGRVRDRHFEATQRNAAFARAKTARAMKVVLAMTVGALLVSALVAYHLLRGVAGPLRQLTRGAESIRAGDFDARVGVESDDDLGALASAFNEMAAGLAAFRRANIGEVLQAKATLEATLEAIPDAVFLLHPDGQILSSNRSARELLVAMGLDDATTIGGLRVPGLDTAGILADVRGRTGEAATMDLARAVHVDLDGEPRRLLPRVVAVESVVAERAGALLLLVDVTDLARLDEMRAELIAVASHELRTPLTTLRMSLLMLGETARSLTAAQTELLHASLGGVDQLAETVDEFLDLTRIEAGKLRLDREVVQLAPIVSACAERVRVRAEENGVAVRITLPRDPPTVLGDPVRLSVVLDNVMSNALKYTPYGGSVSIELSARGAAEGSPERRARVTISDSGPGIPEEFHDRVFEKFFRVEHHLPGTEAGVRGSGIGLYICRQVVELHGGVIRCENASPHGARFVIEL